LGGGGVAGAMGAGARKVDHGEQQAQLKTTKNNVNINPNSEFKTKATNFSPEFTPQCQRRSDSTPIAG